jgi:hypothetical protein
MLRIHAISIEIRGANRELVSGPVTRLLFLYPIETEVFGPQQSNSPDFMRPIDVLAFSVARLSSSANPSGVRSARALYGRL